MNLDFRQFVEAIINLPNPNDPTGRGARRFYVNRIDPQEIQELKAARDALQDTAMGNSAIISALSHLQKAMEVYTRAGTEGQNHPHYKMLLPAYDFFSKQASGKIPVDLQRSLQAIDLAIKQISQAA